MSTTQNVLKLVAAAAVAGAAYYVYQKVRVITCDHESVCDVREFIHPFLAHRREIYSKLPTLGLS